jgi:ribosomal protein S18 acetylase RimI-like enzyme
LGIAVAGPSRIDLIARNRSVIHFRSFRNGDSPALAELWNRGVPRDATAHPLSRYEFDGHVVSKPNFEAAGLTVATVDDRIVGFAHAGFGPFDPVGPALQLCRDMGTIGMFVVEPGLEDPELERGLIVECERYLRREGAKVLYAGGQFPLNPFYWGLYGGSEWAGILSAHTAFHRAVAAAGYEPVSSTLLLEADLAEPDVRDSRGALIRRMARVEVVEDVMPAHWWQALAIGGFRPTGFRLTSKSDVCELARATTWDMNWFGRHDGRSRIGIIDVEVAPEFRRRGYARHLVGEIMRQARTEMVSAVALQTRSTNEPALALYQSMGFVPVESATLYRRAGGEFR